MNEGQKVPCGEAHPESGVLCGREPNHPGHHTAFFVQYEEHWPPSEKVRRCPDGCTFVDGREECLNCANTDRDHAKPEPQQVTVFEEPLEKGWLETSMAEVRKEVESWDKMTIPEVPGVTHFVYDKMGLQVSHDPYRRDYVSYQDFCVVAERLGAAEQRAEDLDSEVECLSKSYEALKLECGTAEQRAAIFEGAFQEAFTDLDGGPDDTFQQRKCAYLKRVIAENNLALAAVKDFLETYDPPSPIEAERDRLKEQLAAMTEDRNLWKDEHDGDCPNATKVAELEEQLAEAAKQIKHHEDDERFSRVIQLEPRQMTDAQLREDTEYSDACRCDGCRFVRHLLELRAQLDYLRTLQVTYEVTANKRWCCRACGANDVFVNKIKHYPGCKLWEILGGPVSLEHLTSHDAQIRRLALEEAAKANCIGCEAGLAVNEYGNHAWDNGYVEECYSAPIRGLIEDKPIAT